MLELQILKLSADLVAFKNTHIESLFISWPFLWHVEVPWPETEPMPEQ